MQTQIYSVVSQKSLEGGASGRTRRTRRAPANSEAGTGVAFRCDYKHVDLRFRRGLCGWKWIITICTFVP